MDRETHRRTSERQAPEDKRVKKDIKTREGCGLIHGGLACVMSDSIIPLLSYAFRFISRSFQRDGAKSPGFGARLVSTRS